MSVVRNDYAKGVTMTSSSGRDVVVVELVSEDVYGYACVVAEVYA